MSAPEPDRPDFFEAVYYSQPVPRDPEVLSILGLVFDRIYFPGVYMPPSGFDEKAVIDEIQRISSLGRLNPNQRQMLECMGFAIQLKHVRDLCIFPGRPGGMEVLEPGVYDVVSQLELMVFGPRPEGVIPIHSGPWIKGLPGATDPLEFQVSAPDSITYPANALVFAARNGLPLINDIEGLPVPGIPGDAKSNAKLLATILTMESVSLVLPKLAALEPAALSDFREELAPHLKPFRAAMLRLAKDLNGVIETSTTLADVQKHARFLVQTDVYPKLAELEAVIKDPAKHWYRRAVDMSKAMPELAVNFLTMPPHLAIAKFLAKTAEVLADMRESQLATQDQLAKSGLHYLLKLKGVAKE
jgi:hypothetical protein